MISLSKSIFSGAIIQVGLRFSMRAMGFVSLAFTARLLSPADFGVIGSASIVTGLFAVLQMNGSYDWIIRKETLTPDDLAGAWTFNLLFNALVSIGIAAAAAPAAMFLNEPALADVLRVSAALPLLGALGSPRTVLLIRDLEFARDFRLKITQKVIDVFCIVNACFLLRSYWGVFFGALAGRVIFSVLTYIIFPWKPKLFIKKISGLFRFSLWTMMLALAIYCSSVVDEIIVRRNASTTLFGLYHVSRDLSRVLVSELVAPAAAALLPGLARLQAERARFVGAAARAVGVAAIVAIAAGAGVSATANEVVALLLGRQWSGAAGFLVWLAIGVAAQTLAGLHRSVLMALGRPDWSALLWFLRAIVLWVVCAAVVGQGGALAVAIAFAVVSIVLTLGDYLVIFWRLGRVAVVPAFFVRPVLAGACMYALLMVLPLPPGLPTMVDLGITVAAGSMIYAAVLMAAWWLAGRPAGPEATLLALLPIRDGRLAAVINRLRGPGRR